MEFQWNKILLCAGFGWLIGFLTGVIIIIYYYPDYTPGVPELIQILHSHLIFSVILGAIPGGFLSFTIGDFSIKTILKKIGLKVFIFNAVCLSLLTYFGLGIQGYYTGVVRMLATETRTRQVYISDKLTDFHGEQTDFPADQNQFEYYIKSTDIDSRFTKDPFHRQGRELMRYYYYPVEQRYLLVGFGPDRILSIPSEVVSDWTENHVTELAPFTYDPTNGIVSPGDIWFMKD